MYSIDFCSTVRHPVKLNRNLHRIFNTVFSIQLNWATVKLNKNHIRIFNRVFNIQLNLTPVSTPIGNFSLLIGLRAGPRRLIPGSPLAKTWCNKMWSAPKPRSPFKGLLSNGTSGKVMEERLMSGRNYFLLLVILWGIPVLVWTLYGQLFNDSGEKLVFGSPRIGNQFLVILVFFKV